MPRSRSYLLAAVAVLSGGCGPNAAPAADAAVEAADAALPDAALDDVADAADAPTADSAPDVQPDLPTDAAAPCDAAAPAGVDEIAPCVADDDCASGACIDTPAGKMCTIACTSGCCPSGWTCASLSPASGAPLVCVPRLLHACDPCTADAQCGSPGDPTGLCLSYGNAGQFCGGTCPGGADSECPAGFACLKSAKGTNGTGNQCVKTDGQCGCSSHAKATGASTVCASTNAFGTCHGNRTCQPSGLTGCDAQAASAEVCNGQDDDCDGTTDGASACPAKLCQTATCDGSTGKCSYKWACDDGNPCTTDACGASGCTHTQLACDSDLNPCTAEVCEPAQGCVHLPQAGSPCDADQNACTAGDHCNATGGCEPGTVVGSCSDGDLCTAGDHCAGAVCLAGAMLACDDGLACTVDACAAALGCTHTVSSACDDGNSCTLDGCNASGCTHTAASGACAMATPCQGPGTCSGTTCSGAKPNSCDDGNPCTTDSCDFAAGCQHAAVPDGATCGDSCGAASTCTQGRCIEVSGLGLHVYSGGSGADCGGGQLAAWSGGYVVTGFACYRRVGSDGEATGGQSGGALAGQTIRAVAADPSGVALAGAVSATASLVKFDAADKLQWQALAKDATDSAWSTVVRDADGWFAAGWQGGAPLQWQGPVTTTGLAAHYDDAGAPEWTLSYPDFAVLAAVARPGGFVLAGVDAKQTVAVRAVDALGQLVWQIPSAGSCALGNNQNPAGCLRLLTVSDGFVLVTPDGDELTLVHISADGVVLQQSAPNGPFVTDFAWAPAGSGLLFAGDYAWDAWDANGGAHSPWPPQPPWFAVYATAAAANHIALAGSAGLYILDAWGNASCAASGACLALPATACDDGIPGTMDRCDAAHGGCWHDGPASLADCPTAACQLATFSPTAGCGAQAIAAGTSCIAACGVPGTCTKWGTCDAAATANASCDDGDACTTDACTATGCSHTALNCAKSSCDPGVCDAASGQCQSAPLPDGTSCGDGGCGSVCMAGGCAVTHGLGNVKPWFSPPPVVIATATGLVGVGQYSPANLLRWDFTGKQLLPTAWNGPLAAIGWPFAMVQTPTDFAVLATDATPTLLRFDPAGVLQSQVALALDPTNIPVALAVDPGGLRIAGSLGMQAVPGLGWYVGKPWLGVVDPAGAVVWQTTLETTLAIQGAQKLLKGFAFIGLSLERTPTVVVADDAGNLLWQTTFGDAQPADSDQLTFAAATDGGLFVQWLQTDQAHVVLTKLDAQGAIAWQRPFADAWMRPLTGLPDGGVAWLGPGALRLDRWGNAVVQAAATLGLGQCLATPLGLACQGNSTGFTFTDPWFNSSCAASGPCLGKSWGDCDDGDPCTADRCDAGHNGCWHLAFPDGSACGAGKACTSGKCQ